MTWNPIVGFCCSVFGLSYDDVGRPSADVTNGRPRPHGTSDGLSHGAPKPTPVLRSMFRSAKASSVASPLVVFDRREVSPASARRFSKESGRDDDRQARLS